MTNDQVNTTRLEQQLSAIEVLLNRIAGLLEPEDQEEFEDWVSERRIQKLTGLGKTTLLKLRTAGKVTASTIEGKGVWYRKSDFKKLLDRNEKER